MAAQNHRHLSSSSSSSDAASYASTMATDGSVVTPNTVPGLPWDARVILERHTQPVAILHEMHQAGVLSSLAFSDDGSNGMLWLYSVAVRLSKNQLDYRFQMTGTKKSAAKFNAAQECVEAVIEGLSTTNSTPSPPSGPVASTSSAPSVHAPTAKQLRAMASDDQHLKTLVNIVLERSDPQCAVVCVSLDLEVYEMDHSKILEVGISYLKNDLLDEVCLQSHHLIVTDHAGLHNGRFCADNREHFLPGFGASEWVDMNKLTGRMEEIVSTATMNANKVYLVGHTVASDVKWLKDAGIRVCEDNVATCDIGCAYRAMVARGQYQNVVGMERMMIEMGIVFDRLHNAGNDARYNLVVLQELQEQILVVYQTAVLMSVVNNLGAQGVRMGHD